MDHQNQVCNTSQSSDSIIRRKRGRSRTNPNQVPAEAAYVPVVLGQNTPPGFAAVDENQPQPVGSANSNNMSPMIGKIVSGVVETEFEGGYLVTVCVGSSNTRLSGIIFKSGRYVPDRPENGPAPAVPRVGTNKMPSPANSETHLAPTVRRARTNRRRLPATNGTRKRHAVLPSNGTPVSNLGAQAQSGQSSMMAVQAPTLDPLEGRATLVPVVLQSEKLASPVIPARRNVTRPPHLAASYVGAAAKTMNRAPLSAETHGSGYCFNTMLPNDSSFNQNESVDLSKPLQTVHPDMPSVSGRTGKMTALMQAMERKDFKDPKN